ncbi:MAG: HAMP domain-containing histidine kinase [Synechococcaceae cyanobacterium SM2_3_60]|nr:HAMP domain-containing histidine kinase [Synechococcaceae cyanobacterium SM2_3_60]
MQRPPDQAHSLPPQRRWGLLRYGGVDSLQGRLTLELVGLSVLGIVSIAGWAGWRLEQTLLAAHKQNLEYVASRFPEQVELYRRDTSLAAGLAQTVDTLSAPGLLIWVRDLEGEVVSQSAGMNSPHPSLMAAIDYDAVPAQPMIMFFNDRYVVLCGNPLSVAGNPIGEVYFLRDITDEQQRVNAGIASLVGFSVVLVGVLVIVIGRRVRRALMPLKEMSAVASAISADELAVAHLELAAAPQEILGLAQSFNAMLTRLSRSWDQQRQFVGNVSHELRTPLAVIAGYLQSLLRRGDTLTPHQHQAVATAAAETERTIRILQDLLDLARADGGSLHFRCEPVILNTLVAEGVAMSEKVSQRSIRLVTPAVAVVACADQARLGQVLLNLLDNALKYSEPESLVEVGVEASADQAVVHVKDHGCGIALAHQARIFERFYRVDEAMTRSRDGTGLGLAIAKSLVEGMGGRLSVRSTPGVGSLFSVALPLWSEPL